MRGVDPVRHARRFSPLPRFHPLAQMNVRDVARAMPPRVLIVAYAAWLLALPCCLLVVSKRRAFSEQGSEVGRYR